MLRKSLSFFFPPLALAALAFACLGFCGAAAAALGDGAAQAPEKSAAQATAHGEAPMLGFHRLLPGLELALTELPESKAGGSGALFVVLRIDPAEHDFALSMASVAGSAHSLADWSRRDNLRAGINAGMYLPDLVTNTGYMRSGEHVNNGRLGGNLGAFFVAGPKKQGLAGARILERDMPGWRDILEEYEVVAQNYRFMDEGGKVLWREGGPLHSIAVAAEDGAGRLLFILAQEPLTGEAFARHLKAFSLDLRTVMYVEGGAQAGIFLRLDTEPGKAEEQQLSLPGAVSKRLPDGVVHVWKGRQSLLNTRGNPEAVLPNIIGVKR